MSLKRQWKTLKENWLIAIIIIVLILVLSNFNFSSIVSIDPGVVKYEDREFGSGSLGILPYGEDFAPGQDIRKIVYSASVGVEVDSGDFDIAENDFDMAVDRYDAIVLNRNVYADDNDRKTGYYNLRVDVRQLDLLLDDLKDIGEVQSESKDSYDITGNYINLQERYKIEQDKLQRLKGFLSEAETISDKIALNDQIAEQERTVEYLLEALESENERVDYASVSFVLEEEKSDFADITFVTFGELVRSFVTSVAGLLKIIFVLIPYALILWVLWVVFRKRKV